jgi:hypothetical protein
MAEPPEQQPGDMQRLSRFVLIRNKNIDFQWFALKMAAWKLFSLNKPKCVESAIERKRYETSSFKKRNACLDLPGRFDPQQRPDFKNC